MDGLLEGLLDGLVEGLLDGDFDGLSLGAFEGDVDGALLGDLLGEVVGEEDPLTEMIPTDKNTAAKREYLNNMLDAFGLTGGWVV